MLKFRTIQNVLQELPNDVRIHSIHTSLYASRIAQSMLTQLKYIYPNLSNDEIINAVSDGALYHDIGKQIFSHRILHKPGALSHSEWTVIKEHPVNAYELLNEDIFFQSKGKEYKEIVMQMCLYHHENIDGSGYPMGIKGDEIPLVAQICAISDVLDALVSERCYHKAIPFDSAFELILNDINVKYCPLILGVFKKLYEPLFKIFSCKKKVTKGCFGGKYENIIM